MLVFHHTDNVTADANPTAGVQGVQCESLRLTRVRGVPLASEALGFGDLLGSIGRRDSTFQAA